MCIVCVSMCVFVPCLWCVYMLCVVCVRAFVYIYIYMCVCNIYILVPFYILYIDIACFF